ncbi:hypothetical protein NPIL_402901 [Nephila pilipes]|uniref:Uncharacterized protein n=1 Tax=Nephila pilipes TaxID=299642 RepID=A0A8X6NGT8_NEPPI|nr:hypothetical protein NPIL_402901 [Nephila pilipes]
MVTQKPHQCTMLLHKNRHLRNMNLSVELAHQRESGASQARFNVTQNKAEKEFERFITANNSSKEQNVCLGYGLEFLSYNHSKISLENSSSILQLDPTIFSTIF